MKKLNKITVVGTYTPEDNGSNMIGGKTFLANVKAKTEVTEDVFKALIGMANDDPPRFKFEEHNYEAYLTSRGRGSEVEVAETVADEAPKADEEAKDEAPKADEETKDETEEKEAVKEAIADAIDDALTDDAPAADEAPKTDDTPAADEAPKTDDTPAADEVPTSKRGRKKAE